jgi:hypothetical protein
LGVIDALGLIFSGYGAAMNGVLSAWNRNGVWTVARSTWLGENL